MSENYESDAKNKEFSIHIDRKMYKVNKDKMSGAELKTMASIGNERDLWQVIPGPQDDVLVEDATIVVLESGIHFHSIKKIVTPGVVLL